ncbi:MAG: hypothetical protein IT195_13595, partial [Microthrixaceae bacterium]|nr:hypothetical protein [Microthrixaceae bacterium]
ATALGEGLSNDKGVRRVLMKSINVDAANGEGTGAAVLYNYLLSRQQKPAGMLEGVRRRLCDVLGIVNCGWGLPGLETTPFSIEHLKAPPPLRKQCFSPTELANACANDNDKMAVLGAATATAAQNLRSVDTLAPPAREESVEEARTILRWLRNLQFSEPTLEEWLNQGTPAEQVGKAEALARLVEVYSGLAHQSAAGRPELLRDLSVEEAGDAAGAIAMALARHSLSMLPPGHAAVPQLETALDAMPERWEMREHQSVKRLLSVIETGIERMTGLAAHAQSPVERLVEISERIRDTARRMRSVDSLEPPAREESIELAREILRKLKNLKLGDTPVEELMTVGKPEDKAAFAQAIDEMAEMYRNLLSEAAHANPAIMNDPRIKEANDAVGTFSHAIALMAAKEIPSSVAAAQKISADVTQMPEDWKGLHHRTVDRLMKSMEGGLEQAVSELMAQQQEQDENIAQEVVDTALHS